MYAFWWEETGITSSPRFNVPCVIFGTSNTEIPLTSFRRTRKRSNSLPGPFWTHPGAEKPPQWSQIFEQPFEERRRWNALSFQV